MQYFFSKCKQKVWNAIEFGWSPPKVFDKEGRLTNIVKPKLERDIGENETSENNVRAIYSIFNVISTYEFFGIVTCRLRRFGISSK